MSDEEIAKLCAELAETGFVGIQSDECEAVLTVLVEARAGLAAMTTRATSAEHALALIKRGDEDGSEYAQVVGLKAQLATARAEILERHRIHGDTLARALLAETQLAAMTAERDALRETNRTLNRRCQDLESENLRIMPRLKELENAYCLREVLPLVGDGDSYHASAKRLIAERDAEIRAHAETKAQAAAMRDALVKILHCNGEYVPLCSVCRDIALAALSPKT